MISRLSAVAIILLLVPRLGDAQPMPVGPEFQVNSLAVNQGAPAIAADSAGNFVVVWQSDGIQAQRYDAAGTPLGGQFQVNSYMTGGKFDPAVAFDGSGDFVVVWMSQGSAGSDTDEASIHVQRYDATGAPVGSELQANTYTTNGQVRGSVAVDPAGNFVVVWQSYGSPGSDHSHASVQAQRFDATGTPVGVEFQVNTYTTREQQYPAIATDAAGNFVVTWESYYAVSDPSSSSVHARRYDATGAALGGQFQVNSYTTDDQSLPAVAMAAAGDFVVAWQSVGSSGSVQAQRWAPGQAAPITGKRIVVKNRSGDESRRAVLVLARETGTDIGPEVFGDPVTNGATLRIILDGTTDSDQTYLLDPAGWRAAGASAFIYRGPTGGDGDPVKLLLLRRSLRGVAILKVGVKGSAGTQSLDVVPPNLGDEGTLILTINDNGGIYCTTFGGAAGGIEVHDDAAIWKVVNATAGSCPTP